MAGQAPLTQLMRARTVLYASIIAIVGSLMLYVLLTRHDFSVAVIHDRNPLFVRLTDGAIRNGYTLRVLNKRLEPRRFALAVDGIAGSVVEIAGLPLGSANIIEVGPDQTREFRVLVSEYTFALPASAPVTFHLTDIDSGERASASDNFRAPQGD